MTSEVRVPTKEDLEYLKIVPSAWVRDSVYRLKIGGCVMDGPLPLSPFGLGNKHVSGPARTVQFMPSRSTGIKTYDVYADVIPSVNPGEVLVVAGNGIPGYAAGENQVNHSIQYGVAAWVTDMRMRDVAEIRNMGFPVLCAGGTPQGVGRDIVGINVPVHIAGAQVRAGDIIVADDDGAVAIPIEAFDQVLANVRDAKEKEARMEQLIKSNAPPGEIAAYLASKSQAI